MEQEKKHLKIKLKNKEESIVVFDDITLIANNLEFLGFAIVEDVATKNKIIFTTDNLLLVEEMETKMDENN